MLSCFSKHTTEDHYQVDESARLISVRPPKADRSPNDPRSRRAAGGARAAGRRAASEGAAGQARRITRSRERRRRRWRPAARTLATAGICSQASSVTSLIAGPRPPGGGARASSEKLGCSPTRRAAVTRILRPGVLTRIASRRRGCPPSARLRAPPSAAPRPRRPPSSGPGPRPIHPRDRARRAQSRRGPWVPVGTRP
jgi:hypothetical protein